MAVDYDVLFGKLGKLVKNESSLSTLQSTTLTASLVEIMAQYGVAATGLGTAQQPIAGIDQRFLTLMDAVGGMRRSIGEYADSTLADYDTVVSQILGLSSADMREVIPMLIQDMYDNSETVNRSIVSLGTVTAYSANVGNGTILVDKVLDGYNPPLLGGISHLLYDGVDSELAPPSASYLFLCSRDSFSGAVDEGGEIFSWLDGIDFGLFDAHGEKPGPGPGLSTIGASGYLRNGDFETWTNTNTPGNWTIASGTAGTHILRSTTAYRGTYALKIVGTGSQATIRLNQALPRLLPRRRYCATVRMRRGSSVPTSGYVELGVYGTDYSPASQDLIRGSLALLSDSYTLYHVFFNTPYNVPDDTGFKILIGGTPDASAEVYIDDVSFRDVTYHGGICAIPVQGSTPFVAGDRFSLSVTNSEGTFQRFFRRKYKVQLPSALGTGYGYALTLPFLLHVNSSGGSSISDSLAA